MLIISTKIIFLFLENVYVIQKSQDLGMVFDEELSFVSYCKETINRTYSMLGLIKKYFVYLCVTLYKSLVRSYLKYANSV